MKKLNNKKYLRKYIREDRRHLRIVDRIIFNFSGFARRDLLLFEEERHNRKINELIYRHNPIIQRQKMFKAQRKDGKEIIKGK